MKAKPLFTEDKEDVVAYYCSECRIVKQTKEQAEACCKPKMCSCGNKLEREWSSKCNACRTIEAENRLKEKLKKAERVTEPANEWVYNDDVPSNDGYFELKEIEDILSWDEDVESPLFVYDCDKEDWKGFDVANLVESAFEGWYEGAADGIVDYEDLVDFLSTWNKKQKAHQYTPSKRIIVLDEDKFNKWLEE